MFVCVHVHMCVSVCGQRRGTWQGGEGRGAVLLERSAGPSQGGLVALARVSALASEQWGSQTHVHSGISRNC